MAVEMVRPAPQEGQPPAQKTVTLTRAALAWDKATDQLVAAAEAEEARLKEKYIAARLAYQEARQQAHLMRQLRGLAKVDSKAAARQTTEPRAKTLHPGRHALKGPCKWCERHGVTTDGN